MIDLQRSLIWWFAALSVMFLADTFWPTAWWFEVRSVYVENTVVGKSPAMTVYRSINRPFNAKWRVELERVGGNFSTNRSFIFVQSAYGENNYTEDVNLPDPLFLDWWTYPQTWELKPGRYRIETCWTINPDIFSPRRVCSYSNVFTISEN